MTLRIRPASGPGIVASGLCSLDNRRRASDRVPRRVHRACAQRGVIRTDVIASVSRARGTRRSRPRPRSAPRGSRPPHPRHQLEPFGMLREVLGDRVAIRCAVLIAQPEHLVVERAVTRAIGDRPKHRPRDRPRLAHRGNRGRLHLERHHTLRPQGRERVGVGDQYVGRPHPTARVPVTHRLGTVFRAGRAVDH